MSGVPGRDNLQSCLSLWCRYLGVSAGVGGEGLRQTDEFGPFVVSGGVVCSECMFVFIIHLLYQSEWKFQSTFQPVIMSIASEQLVSWL